MLLRMFKKAVFQVIDFSWLPVIYLSAALLKFYRRIGSFRMPYTTRLLKNFGVFPIRNHYYEPMFDFGNLKIRGNTKRNLPGLDFNIDQQLILLNRLTYIDEYEYFLCDQENKSDDIAFSLDRSSFKSGDAEFLFQYLCHLKPKRVIEIGCGNTTKLISGALSVNKINHGVDFEHICIEPFEKPWLENLPNIKLVREKVEDTNFDWQSNLSAGDLLFIDSSHMIRPGGDVLFEYLEIIPQLSSGVNIHVHDIFSPYEYPDEWLNERVYFWNEQYLLEAILGNSQRYKVEASLNYLSVDHYESLKKVCPYLDKSRRPGSFYFSIK